MEKGKRALVLMLSVLMLFSTFPASVFAGDEAASEAAPAAAEAQEPVKEPEPEPAPQPETPAEPAKEEAAPAEESAPETPAEETSESADSSDAEQTAEAETNPEEAVASEEEEVVEEEEVKYPAVTLKKTVNGVTVTLKAPEGSLPEGAKLKVSSVDRADVKAAVESKLEAQGKSMDDIVAFDVTPTDKDGKEIQPHKAVTVTFSGTDLDAEKEGEVDVFRVSDDADAVTRMNTSVASEDTQKFSTDHFTIYVLAKSSDPDFTGEVNDPNGDGTNLPNSTDHRYVLEYGQSITLRSSWGSSAEGFDGKPWKVYNSKDEIVNNVLELSGGKGTCTIKNTNETGQIQYLKITHHWASINNPDNIGYEDFFVKVEPATVTFTFMVQDAGESEYKKVGEITTVKGFWIDPPENVPDVKTVDGTSYALDGWYRNESRDPSTKLELLQSDEDITVYAAYQAKSVVKFDWNLAFPRDIDTPNPISGAPSSTVTLPSAPTGVSKWFAGWSTSPDGTPEGTGFFPKTEPTYNLPEGNKEVTLYGVWNYTIKFDAQGGINPPEDRVFYDAKKAVTLPTKEPTRTGYNFAGWKLGDGSGKIYKPGESFTPKQFETTLYAQWEAIQYNIEYKGLEGASFADGTNPEKYTIESEDITLKNPVKEDYKFMGWTGTDLTEATKKVTIPKGSTGDRTYTATWQERKYKLVVTPINAGETATVPDVNEADDKKDVVAAAPSWVETQDMLNLYKACWAGDSTEWDSVITFHGTFEPGETYYGLASIEFEEPEDRDLSIVELEQANGISQVGEPIMRGKNTVMIPFSATVPAGPSYKIEYDLDGGSLEEGVTNPDSYTAADTFTLNNPVKEGYMFKGWTGTDLTELTKEVTIPKKSTGERKYTANWKKLQNYRLKVAQINAGDKVSPPEVSEAGGKQGVMASAMASWVETQEMLDLYKACCAGDSTEWDSVIPYRGTFEAGKTYYGLASLKFEEDEEPDISRVKLEQADGIEQAGDPVIDRFGRSVIIPFSATIPTEELDDYSLNVKKINAGEQAYASTVSEADGKTAVTGVSWVEDEDELRQLVAYWSRESGVHPTRFDETFKGGETYYSLALVSFDVNETPDPSRVKLNETEYIKQEGAMVVHRDENNKNENVVIVPFSATIPEKKITVSVDFGSDHSGFAANVAAHDPTNMKVSGSIVSFEAYAGENLESDGLIPLYDALDDMSPWEDSDHNHRLYVPYFVNGKDISNYSDFEQFNADYNNSIDITMTEDVTVYAQWLTRTQADIEITIPKCGKTTKEYPAPEIVVSGSDDTVTVLDDANDWYSVSEMVPFKGEFEGGNTYIATASISPKFGYFFDEKDITVKDNKDNPASYSLQYGYLMVNVSVEHDWDDWKVTKESTSEEDGEETRVCKGDPSHKETRVIHHKEHTHVLELVEGKDATCTARGQRAYYRCAADGCNYIFEDEKGTKQIGLSDTIIPPKGHKAKTPEERVTPATCSSVGVHVLITKCANEGCTTGVLGIDVTTDPIDPDAHDWGEWKVVTPATCASEGEETRVCKNESLHKETRTIAIDKDAHDWGEWEVTKKPTTTEEGEETRVCKNDPSHKETRPIDKIKEYTITYDLNGGTLNGETGKVSFTVEAGSEITLPEPSRDGYTFDYWQGSKYNAGDKYTVNEDHTFTAQWVAAAEDDEEDSDTSDTSDNGSSKKSSKNSSKKSKVVDTGDAADLMGWILLAIIAETGAAYVYRRRRDF